MKKFLSLVLALVMTMSLVTVAGAEDFTDAAAVNYDEAVDVISALEIVGGYADGSFNPKGTLTRGAAAKIICNILVGVDTASSLVANAAPFSDVPADHVFAGYIAYCVNEGIISGYADGTFKPGNTLTGYAFAKMVLGALGYDQSIEGYTGTNWAINVAQDVAARELTKGLDGKFNGNKAITREEACLLAFNALNSYIVKYADKGSNITIGDIQINTGASSAVICDGNTTGYSAELLKKANFNDLYKSTQAADVVDAYGRPATTWKLVGETDPIGKYTAKATLSYTAKVEKGDLLDAIDALGYALPAGNAVTEIKDAVSGSFDFDTLTKDSDKYGATGVLVELYDTVDDNNDVIDTIVWVESYLGKVTSFTKDKTKTEKVDERTIVTDAGTIKAADETCANFDELYDSLEKGDYVVLTKTAAAVQSAVEAETVEGVVSKVTADAVVIDGVEYAKKAGAAIAVAKTEQTVWLDTYGNVMKGELVDNSSDVVYLTKVYTAADKYGTDTYYAQIVTAEGEAEEILMATPSATVNVGMTTATVGAYTYDKNSDGEAVFTAATATEVASVSGEIKKDAAKVGGKYVTEDVVTIYIEKSGADLKVNVVEGVAAVKAAAAGSFVILNSDDQALAVVILAKADTAVALDDLVYVADNADKGDENDKKGNKQDVYEIYVDGEKTAVIMAGAPTLGWNKYSVDSETGLYTLTPVTVADGAYAASTFTSADINLDKYVAYDITVPADSVKEDLVLAADCGIYDLTENDLNTLAAIDDVMEIEGATSVTLAFTYDADDEVITSIYVTAVTFPVA